LGHFYLREDPDLLRFPDLLTLTLGYSIVV